MRPSTALVAFTLVAACAPIDDAREREVVAVLTRADEALLRSRPLLVASKYRAMSTSLFSFYRGSFALYLHDTTAGHVGESSAHFADVFPLTIGDAHPENFGTLAAADRTLGFEPNDFDAADRYPFLWEVRRLAIGMVIAARASNPDDAAARALARASERDYAFAAAEGYAIELRRLAGGGDRTRLTAPVSEVVVDLFRRSEKDLVSRDELTELTRVDGAERRLLRGALDPADPDAVLEDLPDAARSALPGALAAYRETLVAPPPPAFLAIKDAAREYGSGIASRPRVRMLALVEGPTTSVDDDVILELKEVADSGAPPVTEPTAPADDVQGRIELALQTCWSIRAADPLWGTTSLLGLPIQVRSETKAHKTVRVARLADELGTPDAIAALGLELGGALARVHAGSEGAHPGTLAAIDGAIGADPAAFADEQADVAVAYGDVVEADYARFRDALDVLGPTLGFPTTPDAAIDADVAALYGRPPGTGEAP